VAKMTLYEAYKELGLRPGASKREVKQAYRRLSWELHSDSSPSPDDERLKRVNNAHSVLSTLLEHTSEDLVIWSPGANESADTPTSSSSKSSEEHVGATVTQHKAALSDGDILSRRIGQVKNYRPPIGQPITARRSPETGSPEIVPARPPARNSDPDSYPLPANRLIFRRKPWGTLIVIATIGALAFIGWRIYLDLDSAIRASREREAKHQQEMQAIPRVCNEVFNEADFSAHVDPVLSRLGYKYSGHDSFPTTHSCDWSFKIDGSSLASVVYVSVQCGALAKSTWSELVESGQAVPFDLMPGAYFSAATSSDADDGSAGDRALLRTSSGELVMVYVHLFATMSSDDYPPLAHRKEILAAVLPVTSEHESAKRIC
jgi:hypothetical protein